MARVRKRVGKYKTSYQVRWLDPETGKEEAMTVDSEAAAETLKRALDANGQTFSAATRVINDRGVTGPTVKQTINEYIDQTTGASPYTIKKYQDNVRLHFSGRLGNLKTQTLKPVDITRWVKEVEASGKAPKTIANLHGLLSAAMNMAVRDGLIDRNPCRGIKLPKAHHAGDDNTMVTMEDWLRIRDNMDPFFHPFFDLLVGTGLRFSEATALKAEDFKLNGRPPTVRVNKAHKMSGEGAGRYVGAPKTRKGKRTVSLAPSTVEAVRPVVEAAGDGLVFKMRQGGVLTWSSCYQRAWDPARSKAALDKRVTIHSLRHLHAAMMLGAGMDMYDLSRRLGHENISVSVDLYSHLLPDAQWKGANIAAKALAARPIPQIEAS